MRATNRTLTNSYGDTMTDADVLRRAIFLVREGADFRAAIFHGYYRGRRRYEGRSPLVLGPLESALRDYTDGSYITDDQALNAMIAHLAALEA